MDDLKKLQRKEALARLKLLKVHKNVIEDFKGEVINYSERQNQYFDGILYWVGNDPKFTKAVEDFEKRYNCLVYHCQLTHTEFGDHLTLLFVSTHPDAWEDDKKDLVRGDIYAYVETFDECSEFGMVGIVPKNGGVARTY